MIENVVFRIFIAIVVLLVVLYILVPNLFIVKKSNLNSAELDKIDQETIDILANKNKTERSV